MTSTAADEQATKFAWLHAGGEPNWEQIAFMVPVNKARDRI